MTVSLPTARVHVPARALPPRQTRGEPHDEERAEEDAEDPHVVHRLDSPIRVVSIRRAEPRARISRAAPIRKPRIRRAREQPRGEPGTRALGEHEAAPDVG